MGKEPMEQQSDLLDCPDCFVRLVRIKSKQPKTKDQYFVKCPYNVKGDPSTCGFIQSEEQYEVWAAKRRRELQAGNVDPTAVMPMSGEGLADLRHEVKQLKQIVDSVVGEVWNLKMQKGVPMQQPDNRKWQIVVDFSVVATLVVGVLIGVFCALIWK